MKKKGQSVKIKTAVINKRKKLVPSDYKGDCEVKNFTVIRTPLENDPYYMIVVEDDMTGWIVTDFHIIHMEVDKKYRGKKFFDVSEIYFC